MLCKHISAAQASSYSLCERLAGLPFSGAVDDFTIAVEQAPFFADGWKRRGQARSALGQNQEALEVHYCTPFAP